MSANRASIWSTVLVYALTVLAVTVAASVRMALGRLYNDIPPYITFYPVVVLAALLGGLGAGLLATALAALACVYLFLSPVGSLRLDRPGQAVALAMFCTVSVLISWVAQALRGNLARRKAAEILLRQRQEQLERVQDELHQQIDQMQTLMQILPVGVFIAQDRQCRTITANRAGHEILRLPVGANLSASAPADQRPAFVAMRDGQVLSPEQLPMQLAAARGIEVQDAEVRHVYRDGVVVDFFGSAVPLRDPNGAVRGAVGVFVDITTRKQAEEALRGFFDASAVYMSIVELDHDDLIYVMPNAKMAERFGLRVDQVAGKRASELGVDKAGVGMGVDVLRQCHEARRPISREYSLNIQGREAWCYSTISPIAPGPSGHPRFALVTIDITERKQAEAALQRYQLLANNSRDIILFTDRETACILEANAAAVQAYGYSYEELLAMKVHDLRSSDTVDLVGMQMADADTHGVLFETVHRRKDGSVFPAEVSSHGATIAGRRMLISVVRDITERKKTQAALEQASAAKDQFLAMLSHELRTPLNPVLMTVTALQHDTTLPLQVREDLQMIRRNVELEARLIDDLLDITRISRGKLHLQRQPISIAAVIRDAVQTCAPDTLAKGLRLSVRPCEQELYVNGDPTRLQQVVWNLIKNAIKFTPYGEIEVACRYEDGFAVITVRDEGMGIEPAMLGRIFNAFDQGGDGTARRFGGLGMGLAITRALVEMHEGTVTAYSQGRGTGATFTVRLPLTQAPAEAMRAASGMPGDPVVQARVLLVEDHEDSARMLTRLLQNQGFDVQWAGDVAGALALARQHRFDVVISDISLPDGTGLELMRQLLAEQPGLKGIALSGHGSESDTRLSHESGFSAHLVKPINPHQLRQTMLQIIAEAHHTGASQGAQE